MKGMANFVIGFGLSLLSVSVAGQLYSPSSQSSFRPNIRHNIKIDLFKPSDRVAPLNDNLVIAEVKKETLFASASTVSTPNSSIFTEFSPAEADILDDTGLQGLEIAYSPEQNIDGADDAEILSINIDDDIIPIDYETASNNDFGIEIAQSDDDNKVAMLPTHPLAEEETFAADNPWVVARGSKHIDNKKLLEKYQDNEPEDLFTDNAQKIAETDENISYKVAERIKQSIIFPIPDEILNDENLTPTFISDVSATKKDTSKKNARTKAAPTQKEKNIISTENSELKVLPKKPVAKAEEKKESGFLNSISSWFTDKKETQQPDKPRNKPKKAASYSSQGETPQPQTNSSSNDALVSFYETLQQTKEEQAKRKIVPSELKLSFQPGRAEISGQTLRWLKAFSEKAQEDASYLQIRLDATASIELQKKRLNLLYTIFMNNGVDPKKIDTVFSLTEPNAFVIRTLQLKKRTR